MLNKTPLLTINMPLKSIAKTGLLSLCLCLFLSACSTNQLHNKLSDTATSSAISVVYPSWDLQDALNKANTLDRDSTLVVFDIDDTLLTATEFYGSDKWYDWQRGRALDQQGLKINTANNDKVNCLFDVLGMVFEMSVNKPTQPNMADIVDKVENDLVILTARSSAYRSATMRELSRNKLNFTEKSLSPNSIAYYYDYTLGGRTAQLSYVNGVFMVQGMNKGVLLLDLLQRTGRKYSNVIFVDDKQHNLDNMQKALKEANINYYGFHYKRISKAVSKTEIAQATSANIALTKLLQDHFAERAEHISQEQCDY